MGSYHGLSSVQVGVLGLVRPFVNFVASPLWAGLSDRTQQHAKVYFTTLLLSITGRCLFL